MRTGPPDITASEPMRRPRDRSDEHYLLDLCDSALGWTARRQHRFPFLLGDPGRDGRCARLPVDAWYEDLALVVEVMERQHREPVPFFDRRSTVSGIGRGEQRRRYDLRRAEVLPLHGIKLVLLPTCDFPMRQGCLARHSTQDEAVIRQKLAAFM